MKLGFISAAGIVLAAWAWAQPAPETPAVPDEPPVEAAQPPDLAPELPPPPDPGPFTFEVNQLVETLARGGRTLFERLPPPPEVVLRAIIGFVALLVLAYLAGHPRVLRLERRLNIAHLTTAGLPFVLLGFIASRPFIGILPTAVLEEIGPLLPLGLGWIGFVIGSRFTGAALDRLEPGIGASVVATTCIPLAVIFIAATPLLRNLDPLLALTQDREALRDGILVAAAGAMAARSAPYFFAAIFAAPLSQRMLRIIEVEQLAGVTAMMLLSAFIRPEFAVVAWQLPGAAWLFVIFGMGSIMGLVIAAILNHVGQGSQFTAALLGAVAFTAGMASYLRLSPIAVSFIAGAILMNLGGAWRTQATAVLERMERPIYFVFLFIAGALWHPWEWQGWALMAVFVCARFLSKWFAAALLERFWLKDVSRAERWTLVGAPMGALSVAMIVSAQDLYSGQAIGWIVTAVIGGTVVMEVALQVTTRRAARGLARLDASAAAPSAD